MDMELVGWVFNIIFALLGFAGAFVIDRLAKSIDSLTKADTDIRILIMEHREDVIKNYATAVAVQQLRTDIQQQTHEYKKDIIGRVDRLEMTFKEALMAHEHRENQLYSARAAAGKEQT